MVLVMNGSLSALDSVLPGKERHRGFENFLQVYLGASVWGRVIRRLVRWEGDVPAGRVVRADRRKDPDACFREHGFALSDADDANAEAIGIEIAVRHLRTGDQIDLQIGDSGLPGAVSHPQASMDATSICVQGINLGVEWRR